MPAQAALFQVRRDKPANSRARAFYAHHGYQEEDIRLAKALR